MNFTYNNIIVKPIYFIDFLICSMWFNTQTIPKLCQHILKTNQSGVGDIRANLLSLILPRGRNVPKEIKLFAV